MPCPNCGNNLTEQTIENQRLLHCVRCGVTFFEENAINRISEEAAIRIRADRREDIISDSPKNCPRDHTPLAEVKNEGRVPPNVVLLRCTTCRGLLVYPHDLVVFARAQHAKLNYYKLWSKPMDSLRSVLILTFLLFTVSAIGAGMYALSRPAPPPSRATELITNIEIRASGSLVLISFKTAVPAQSKIVFKESVSGQVIENVITTKLQTFHQLTTGELDLSQDIYYQIFVYDLEAQEVGRSDEVKLNIQ